MVNKTQISGIIWLKFVITLVVTIILFMVYDQLTALSGLLGGAIAFSGSVIYAWVAYNKNNYVAPIILMKRHFLAEFIKMGLTIFAFALTFIFFRQVVWIALFAGYIFATAAYWLGLLFKFGK